MPDELFIIDGDIDVLHGRMQCDEGMGVITLEAPSSMPRPARLGAFFIHGGTMYKTQSALSQRRYDRETLITPILSDETLNSEQKRENLVKISKLLTVEIQGLRGSARTAIGKAIYEIGQEINALRPKGRAPGVQDFFIDAARDFLTKSQFDIVMSAAVKKMRESGDTQ